MHDCTNTHCEFYLGAMVCDRERNQNQMENFKLLYLFQAAKIRIHGSRPFDEECMDTKT